MTTETATDTGAAHLDDRRAIVILGLGIFAMVTSEFVVAGLMPQLAAGLEVSTAQIGYLITAFVVAMALGGPVLTVAMLLSRLISGAASQAFFGVAISMCTRLSLPPIRGRANRDGHERADAWHVARAADGDFHRWRARLACSVRGHRRADACVGQVC